MKQLKARAQWARIALRVVGQVLLVVRVRRPFGLGHVHGDGQSKVVGHLDEGLGQEVPDAAVGGVRREGPVGLQTQEAVSLYLRGHVLRRHVGRDHHVDGRFGVLLHLLGHPVVMAFRVDPPRDRRAEYQVMHPAARIQLLRPGEVVLVVDLHPEPGRFRGKLSPVPFRPHVHVHVVDGFRHEIGQFLVPEASIEILIVWYAHEDSSRMRGIAVWCCGEIGVGASAVPPLPRKNGNRLFYRARPVQCTPIAHPFQDQKKL